MRMVSIFKGMSAILIPEQSVQLDPMGFGSIMNVIHTILEFCYMGQFIFGVFVCQYIKASLLQSSCKHFKCEQYLNYFVCSKRGPLSRLDSIYAHQQIIHSVESNSLKIERLLLDCFKSLVFRVIHSALYMEATDILFRHK